LCWRHMPLALRAEIFVLQPGARQVRGMLGRDA
jgi:hypothetical protein